MSIISILSPAKFFSRAKVRIKKANWEFWIGNFVVVLSTVLGVYLAAHAALETAIKFEAVREDRDNYYVRSSLRNEIHHNISVYEEIVKNYQSGGSSYRKTSQWLNHPEYLIWESLKSSPALLTTPPEILAGITDFYKYSELVIEKIHNKGPSNRTVYLVNKFEEKINAFKTEVLPVIDNNIATLKKDLSEQKIELR